MSILSPESVMAQGIGMWKLTLFCNPYFLQRGFIPKSSNKLIKDTSSYHEELGGIEQGS